MNPFGEGNALFGQRPCALHILQGGDEDWWQLNFTEQLRQVEVTRTQLRLLSDRCFGHTLLLLILPVVSVKCTATLPIPCEVRDKEYLPHSASYLSSL